MREEPTGIAPPACNDRFDNDADGASDLADAGGHDATSLSEQTHCQDGSDNDSDGLIDFDGGQSIHGACSGSMRPPGVSDREGDGVGNPDPECVGKPWRNRETAGRCGLCFELALLLPLLLWQFGRKRLMPVILIALLAAPAMARERQDVVFEIVHAVPNPLVYAVYVLGSLPELGEGDLTRAVKLHSEDGNAWRVTVSLPANRTYTYQYYERIFHPSLFEDPANGTPVGVELTGSTDSVPLVPAAKTMLYHSEFDRPLLHWRQDDGPFETLVMEDAGPGRAGSERRWAARDFGESRRAVEFFVTDTTGSERNPAGSATYETPLDIFLLQDENLFTYLPAASVSPRRRDYAILPDGTSSTQLFSTFLEGVREYRVLLPRGYDEHTQRAYPVVYLHDGKAMWDEELLGIAFDPAGAGVAEAIRLGRVGEVIQVGIDNVEAVDSCPEYDTRTRDYVPPGDSFQHVLWCPEVGGEADRYADFLRFELEPLIAAQYRTLPGAANRLTAGWSLGGIAALYLGWEVPDTFGRIGALSGSFWMPNYSAQVMAEPSRPIRIYMDSGTLGDDVTIYLATLSLRDNLLGRVADPYVLEADLQHRVAGGAAHTVPDAGLRLPDLLAFLRPATEEPQELLPSRSVPIDIKPGSCPNSYNRSSNGVLPVAVVGTQEFDVSQVELSSVEICSLDGSGNVAQKCGMSGTEACCVGPREGPPGPNSELEDVTEPYAGSEACGCEASGPDGVLDLSLKFKTADLVEALQLDLLPQGALPELVVRGSLLDGTAFQGSDCVRLVPRGRRSSSGKE